MEMKDNTLWGSRNRVYDADVLRALIFRHRDIPYTKNPGHVVERERSSQGAVTLAVCCGT